jgi:single-stranded-DNA-specific exonuclease
VVIGFEGDIGKGSARSIPGVDLGAAVQRLAAEGLIERGGGHPMAAGLTLTRAQLGPAMDRLAGLLARQGAGAAGPAELRIDGLLTPGAATVDLAEALEAAGPFGAAAPAPRFALPDVAVQAARRIGGGHLRLTLGDGLGGRLEAMLFGAEGTALGALLEGHGGRRLHLAGRIEANAWQGRRTARLRIEDAAPADPAGAAGGR